MNEHATSSVPLTLPPRHLVIPSAPIAIRVATMADLPFMDGLQKRHSKQLGYFPTKQFEGYIEGGHVLVAEERHEGTEARRHEGRDEEARERVDSLPASPPHSPLRASVPSCLRASPPASPLGYIISRDRYLKRDELGVIYQLCVAPDHQRGLIGATLVKEVFARSAYGCRLYCCWCAQDLEANYFWESLGFVPIAFRAGGRKTLRRRSGQGRVHIFWQRRIDRPESITTHQSPYWYPFQTNGGAIRADRIVFPIPPGVHWRDIRPPDVRAVEVAGATRPCLEERKQDGGGSPMPRKPKKAATGPGPGKVGILVGGRIKYVDRPGDRADNSAITPARPKPQKATTATTAKAGRERSRRIDPTYLAAARELRDRALEYVNGGHADDPVVLRAPAGKYDVTRPLSDPADTKPVPLLITAA